MKVNIRNLKNGPFEIDESAQLELTQGSELLAPVSVHVRGNKVDDEYYLEVGFSAKINLQCDRCLENYVDIIKDEFKLTLSKNPDLVYDEKNESVIFIEADSHEVNLESELAEELLIAMPMKRLHDPDCKGLCDRCGVNLNHESCTCEAVMDPRWDALKKIKFNN